jgi:hypothetical protein
MQIQIAVSKQMEAKKENDLSFEKRLIRMPKEMREALGLKTDTYLNMVTKTGEVVSLIIGRAYEADAIVNPKCAYVTNDVYKLLIDNAAYHEVERCESITLGCDPELFIVDNRNGHMVLANQIFPKWDYPGSDGGLLEFRPLPSTDEATVTKTMYGQMLRAREVIKSGRTKYRGNFDGSSYIILARSHYRPPATQRLSVQTAGFHVHFGLPKPLLVWNVRDVHIQMIKLLDYYVGFPSILMEGEIDTYRRTCTGLAYGKPGDFRPGPITLEYRVPGGVLMKHPILSTGLLALSNVVMEDMISRVKHCTNNYKNLNEFDKDEHVRELYPNLPPLMEVYRCICSPTLHSIQSHMAALRADIEKMIGYAKHAKNIENFFNMSYEPHKVSENVEHNWRTFYEQRQQGAVAVLQ